MVEAAEKRKRAEDFADRMEAEFEDLGASSDFFCSKQRVRWREHAIRAYEGVSSTEEKSNSESTADSSS